MPRLSFCRVGVWSVLLQNVLQVSALHVGFYCTKRRPSCSRASRVGLISCNFGPGLKIHFRGVDFLHAPLLVFYTSQFLTYGDYVLRTLPLGPFSMLEKKCAVRGWRSIILLLVCLAGFRWSLKGFFYELRFPLLKNVLQSNRLPLWQANKMLPSSTCTTTANCNNKIPRCLLVGFSIGNVLGFFWGFTYGSASSPSRNTVHCSVSLERPSLQVLLSPPPPLFDRRFRVVVLFIVGQVAVRKLAYSK